MNTIANAIRRQALNAVTSAEKRSPLSGASTRSPFSCRNYWGGTHLSYGDAESFKGKLSVRHVPVNRAGYTSGRWGQYVGVGQPLYEVENEDGSVSFNIRASDRQHAREEVRRCYPSAKV